MMTKREERMRACILTLLFALGVYAMTCIPSALAWMGNIWLSDDTPAVVCVYPHPPSTHVVCGVPRAEPRAYEEYQ